MRPEQELQEKVSLLHLLLLNLLLLLLLLLLLGHTPPLLQQRQHRLQAVRSKPRLLVLLFFPVGEQPQPLLQLTLLLIVQ